MKAKIVDFNKWWDYDHETLVEVINHDRSSDKKISINDVDAYINFALMMEEVVPGVGHTYFSGDDAKKIGKAFFDSFKAAGREMMKFVPLTKFLAKTFTGGIKSIFVPVGESYWEEVKKERDESIKKITDKNKDFFDTVQKQISGNDLAIIAAMANPGYFLAAKVAQKMMFDEEKPTEKPGGSSAREGGASGETSGASGSAASAATGATAGAAVGAAVEQFSPKKAKAALNSTLAGAVANKPLTARELSKNKQLINNIMQNLSQDPKFKEYVNGLKQRSSNVVQDFKAFAAKIEKQADLIASAKRVEDLKKEEIMGMKASNKLDSVVNDIKQKIEQKSPEQTPKNLAEDLLKTVKLVLLSTLTRSLDLELSVVAANSEIKNSYEKARQHIEQKKNSVR